MSKKDKVWFNWHCPHCKYRNKERFPFQFKIPGGYSVIWKCDRCEKESEIIWDLRVEGWFKRRT